MQDEIIQQVKTSISNTTIIIGDIRAEEHLIINGTVKGNIEISGHNFFLGPSGKLEGKIQAQNVKIRGNMDGEIKANEKVEITREANFSGKIQSKSISVENGAYFDAIVNLDQKSTGTGTEKELSEDKAIRSQ
jgi:cytoskeletal protein CcmA (bactofilin family)